MAFSSSVLGVITKWTTWWPQNSQLKALIYLCKLYNFISSVRLTCNRILFSFSKILAFIILPTSVVVMQPKIWTEINRPMTHVLRTYPLKLMQSLSPFLPLPVLHCKVFPWNSFSSLLPISCWRFKEPPNMSSECFLEYYYLLVCFGEFYAKWCCSFTSHMWGGCVVKLNIQL